MKVNGQEFAPETGLTVLQLLQQRGLDPQRVAVERNGAIVPRATFETMALCAGDTLEIVSFVGGG